jgi:hypothetical protein
MGASSCSACPAGQTSNTVSAGTACVPCAAGRYTDQPTARYNASCGAVCEAGKFCPAGSSISNGLIVPCGGREVFCPAGTPARVQVGSGNRTLCAKTVYASGIFSCYDQEACTPGRYAFSGQCLDCNTGGSQPLEGKAYCTPCSAGMFANVSQATECKPCEIGTFAQSTGATVCTPCAAGTAANSTGAVMCTECKPGESSVARQSSCTQCRPGRYSDAFNSPSCVQCSAGSFAHEAGSTSCEDCQPGRFARSAGLSGCSQCEPGTYNPSNSSQTCFPCPPYVACTDTHPQWEHCARILIMWLLSDEVCGSAVTSMRFHLSSASLCARAHHLFSMHVCVFVCSGSSTSEFGADICTPCAQGQQQPSHGMTSCEPCPDRTYSNVIGSMSCAICTTSVNDNRTVCEVSNCPSGSEFDPNTGHCALCRLGYSSPRGGSCQVCPAATFQPSRGAQCQSCSIRGLQCSNGLVSVQPGFFVYSFNVSVVDPDNSEQMRIESMFATAVCPLSFCPGSALFSSTKVSHTLNTSAITSESSAIYTLGTQCISPRMSSEENILCGACIEGYINWSGECVGQSSKRQ